VRRELEVKLQFPLCMLKSGGAMKQAGRAGQVITFKVTLRKFLVALLCANLIYTCTIALSRDLCFLSCSRANVLQLRYLYCFSSSIFLIF
jgi:hypothetical protein